MLLRRRDFDVLGMDETVENPLIFTVPYHQVKFLSVEDLNGGGRVYYCVKDVGEQIQDL